MIPNLFMVNGEAEHGKDLVADWISLRFGLVKIALADPMKRFARHLFGFPAENLWGPSALRNIELAAKPMWDRAFTMLHVMHEFVVVVVPEKMGAEKRALAYEVFQNWFTKLRKEHPDTLSARIALQTLGTECGRAIDPLIWANYLFDVQVPLLAQGYVYTSELGVRTNLDPEEPKNGIIVPDQRFENELVRGEEKGVYSLRVRRLSKVHKNTNIGIQGHQSEMEMRGIPDSRYSKLFEFEEGLESVYLTLGRWAQGLENEAMSA